MNERVMKKWTKALRSGKYKQGRAALCVEDSKGNKSFCCLGVLCDLYNTEMKKNKKKTLAVERHSANEIIVEYNPKAEFFYYFNSSYAELPEEVMDWAGFAPGNYEGSFAGDFPELVVMNDGAWDHMKAQSFKQIASAIEKNHDLL